MTSIADGDQGKARRPRRARADMLDDGRTILANYTTSNSLRRNRSKLIWLFTAFAILYGMAFGIFASYFLLQLMIPLVVLVLLIIWVLPEMDYAPVDLLDKLVLTFIVALLCWPDYLALAFPGLPWITMIRLVIVPLLLTLLICVSISGAFRAQMKEVFNETPLVWKGLVTFAVIAFISIAFSRDIANSINKFTVAILYWVTIFFASAYVFQRRTRAQILVYMLWAIAVYVCLIAAWEWRLQAVPWAGRIPSFLAIQDPSVQQILSAKSRAALGIYRVQSKFTTPLGLAEFMALSTPFVLHIILTSKQWIFRIAAAATIPLIFNTIIMTDSRLGVVGFFMSFLLYFLAWGVWRWRNDRDSIFGPAIVIGYPVVLGLFIAATFFVGRLRAMVWGGGAQQYSTQAREQQVAAGMPMIMKHPWGHGIGQGALTLNHRNQAGELTIDTYYLAVGLEYGVIGFIVYYGMFLAAIIYGGLAYMKARSTDTMVLAPLCIALTNFFVIKAIFSQQENHPAVFLMLGAVTALVLKVRKEQEELGMVPQPLRNAAR
ncbi:MAG: O-antigen ligase family protein [Sphingobium sp.]|nr:O-antigen ligase family protein [Sphingobium sp.]MCP5397838.1 O-antigen ligase family protein [Sphingomonas sp.]